MSHIVTIQTRVHDAAAVAAACRRLGLAEPVQGKARLYSGEAEGLLLQLPGWRYPAVIDVLTGAVRFDLFEGRWGDRLHLDRFLQLYAVEKAKVEARKKGYAVSEQQLQDGSIRLQIVEIAWNAMNLGQFQAHPVNRGWMNTFRRWTSSAAFHRYWPFLRAEYSKPFVAFCENVLNLLSQHLM